ncbi:MAG: AlpA family phage regulatory protein [Burkholderiales bacterium]|nr:AlpA family phage regulatory protein [Burkholderiales bacterium]
MFTSNHVTERRPRRVAPVDVIAEAGALLAAGGMLRAAHVAALCGMPRSSLARALAAGTFPTPALRGHRKSLWRAADIRAYLDRMGG